jgi:hypothetical protein
MATHFTLVLKIEKVTTRVASDGTVNRRSTSAVTTDRKVVSEVVSVTLRANEYGDILLKAQKLIELERDLSGVDVKVASDVLPAHEIEEDEDD